MDELKWLQEWYSSKCDGEWEEYYGIKINTIDNPGWLVEVDILETEYEDKKFAPINVDNSEEDWIQCKVENGKFIGAGDQTKLSQIISVFREWASSGC